MSQPHGHYIVTAHVSDGLDETHYVREFSAEAAQDLVKAFMKQESGDPEVYCTLVVEIPGPPLSIHTEDEIVDKPAALTREAIIEEPHIPTPEERAANRLALLKMHRGNRFRLMFGLPLLQEPENQHKIENNGQ